MGGGQRNRTGTEVRKTVLPVRLYGFENPERMITRSLQVSPSDFLTHGEAQEIKDQLGLADIEDGDYIYVFRNGPSGWWLRHELTKAWDGFHRVPWGKTREESAEAGRKYQPSKDETYENRPAKEQSLDSDEIPLDVSREHVIIRSRFQLPYHRIEAYQTDESLLRSRGVTLPAGSTASPSADGDFAIVHVPDLISVAEAFHEEYVDALSRLRERMTPLKTKKRLLASLIQGVVKQNPDLKTHIRAGEVDQYLEEVTRSLKEDKQLVKRAATYHRACITMEGFEAALDDLTGKKLYEEKAQEIYADLLRGLPEHPEGLETLQEIASLPDGWAHRLLLSPEGFQFISESVAAADELENIAVPFFLGRALHYLEQARETSTQLIHKDVKGFLDAYKHYGRFTSGTLVVIEQDERGTNRILEITSEEAALSRGYARNKKWAQRVGKLGPSLQKLVLAAELINLTLAGSEVVQSVQGKEANGMTMPTVNLVGSAADSIDAAKFLLQKTEAGQSVIASKSGSVAFKAVGVIGVICDYTSGVVGAYRASDKGNLGTSVGHGLTALGAVSFGTAMALEGGLLSSGGIVAATATSIGTGGLMLIGALLFAGGTFVISFYTQAPIEKYLRSSPWGKESKYQGYQISGIQEGKLEEYISRFLEIVWQPRIKMKSDEGRDIDVWVMTPIYFSEETEIKVDFTITARSAGPYQSQEPSSNEVSDGTLQLPDNQTTVVSKKGTYELRRGISVDTGAINPDSSTVWLTYEARIKAKLTRYDEPQFVNRSGHVE